MMDLSAIHLLAPVRLSETANKAFLDETGKAITLTDFAKWFSSRFSPTAQQLKADLVALGWPELAPLEVFVNPVRIVSRSPN